MNCNGQWSFNILWMNIKKVARDEITRIRKTWTSFSIQWWNKRMYEDTQQQEEGRMRADKLQSVEAAYNMYGSDRHSKVVWNEWQKYNVNFTACNWGTIWINSDNLFSEFQSFTQIRDAAGGSKTSSSNSMSRQRSLMSVRPGHKEDVFFQTQLHPGRNHKNYFATVQSFIKINSRPRIIITFVIICL